MRASQDSLTQLFLALADPSRRSMIDRLASGPASVKALAEARGIAMPSAVKHLQILEQAGLVMSRKNGRVRTFQVREQALRSIEDWLESHRKMLHEAFDRLERLMIAEEGEADR